MTLPVSPHHPLFAAGLETITGKLDVDIGLRDVQGFQANIQTPSADTNFIKWTLFEKGVSIWVSLEVLDSTFTTATDPATVSWIALGK
jgi:hypothetical protein